MLRLTEIRLPLDHTENELKQAILDRLDILENELLGFTVYRRNYDARKKTAIVFSYTVDVETGNEKSCSTFGGFFGEVISLEAASSDFLGAFWVMGINH